MADLRPQYNEGAVGANHPTKVDVINRAYNVEHGEDGTHGAITGDSIIKGWIQFNGTGVIAIQDSFNVSGIVDNGIGDYTVTWDTNFANDDYAAVASSNKWHTSVSIHTVGDVGILTATGGEVANDANAISLIAIGDQ